jgi:hypothetical protein
MLVGATTLGLVIDGSGSISGANFTTQQTAYVNAINNVVDSSFFGNLAIGVYQFSSGVQQEIGYTAINNFADLGLVTTAISSMTQLNGLTNISAGITTATNNAIAFGAGTNSNLVIDVSTDGFHNQGVMPPLVASQLAVANGLAGPFTDVQVNELLIGGGAGGGFHFGGPVDNSFSVLAGDFSDLQAVLEGKLARELNPIPEPSTMILIGFGLLGLAGVSRKKLKK